MKGNPLRDTFLLLLVLATLAFPLWKVTTAKAVEASTGDIVASAAAPEGGRLPMDVLVRSAHVFTNAKITIGGEAYELAADEAITLSYAPGEILELTLEATWPEETPETALLLIIEPDGLETIERTFWGEGEIFEDLNIRLKGDTF